MGQWRFQNPGSAQSSSISSNPDHLRSSASTPPAFGHSWAFWAVRVALISVSALLCYNLGPFGFRGLPAVGLGFLMAMVILLAELRMRRAEISGLMGGALGGVLGLLASLLITLVVYRTSEPEATKSFLEFTSLFALGYLGLGSCKGQHFRPTALSESAELPTANFLR